MKVAVDSEMMVGVNFYLTVTLKVSSLRMRLVERNFVSCELSFEL